MYAPTASPYTKEDLYCSHINFQFILISNKNSLYSSNQNSVYTTLVVDTKIRLHKKIKVFFDYDQDYQENVLKLFFTGSSKFLYILFLQILCRSIKTVDMTFLVSLRKFIENFLICI